MLISHICHAARRLDSYEAFVIKRDTMIMRIEKERTGRRPTGGDYLLAMLYESPVYEAHASKTCRLTRTLVESCGSALINLRLMCLDPLVESGESSENSNTHPEDRLILLLQKNFHQLANDTAVGT